MCRKRERERQGGEHVEVTEGKPNKRIHCGSQRICTLASTWNSRAGGFAHFLESDCALVDPPSTDFSARRLRVRLPLGTKHGTNPSHAPRETVRECLPLLPMDPPTLVLLLLSFVASLRLYYLLHYRPNEHHSEDHNHNQSVDRNGYIRVQ